MSSDSPAHELCDASEHCLLCAVAVALSPPHAVAPEALQEVAAVPRRWNFHLEQQEDGEKDNESAYMYAMQDMESARKRKDTAAWYPEYEKMGFDHPRPDYKDPKWKL